MTQDTPTHQDEPGAPRAPLGFGRTQTSDPIDAAIERHRAAREELQRATGGVDAAMTASQRAESEAEAVFSAASHADGAAWADLIATRPDDVPGAVRLLRYVSDSPASEIVEDPQELLRQLTAAVEAAETGGRQIGGAPAAGAPVEVADPDPVDWHSPPSGFMASPAIKPSGFVLIEEGVRIELERLPEVAQTEFSRLTGAGTTAECAERLRRQLRLDALEKAVRGEGGFPIDPSATSVTRAWDWQVEAARHPGFVPFPTHAPTMLLALDQVIRREAERFLALAEAEVERSRLALAGDPDPNLWPRVELEMRRELRMDALALVAADLPEDDGSPDPVLAAIAASRRAEAEMAAFQNGPQGPPPEGWQLREQALYTAQRSTLATVWRTVPTTRAGRRALVNYARFQVEVHTGATGIIDDAKELFEEILAPIAAAIDAERPETPSGPDGDDPAAAALVSAIEAEWRTWAGLHRGERGDAAFEASCQRRDALLDAAEALPASSQVARHAKALARAWVDWVEDERPGRPRGVYSFEGRLVFDVHASIAAAKEAPAESHRSVPTGYNLAILTVAQLARLYGALEPFEDLIGRAETVRTPDGDIICQEADRLGRLVRAIVEEIGLRRPANEVDRIDRLNVLVRRAALLNDLNTDRALLTEALAASEG